MIIMGILPSSVALIILLSSSLLLQDSAIPLRPPRLRLDLPSAGFVQIDEDRTDRSCGEISDTGWTRMAGNAFALWAHASGPSGSGRYWTITIGLSNGTDDLPVRGICLTTSTIGWRTLQHFGRLPLPWTSDEDGDGDPEIILWSSFPLKQEATGADFGLVGWVYRRDTSGTFWYDAALSKNLASEIATSYQEPLKGGSESLLKRRARAATALEGFASDR